MLARNRGGDNDRLDRIDIGEFAKSVHVPEHRHALEKLAGSRFRAGDDAEDLVAGFRGAGEQLKDIDRLRPLAHNQRTLGKKSAADGDAVQPANRPDAQENEQSGQQKNAAANVQAKTGIKDQDNDYQADRRGNEREVEGSTLSFQGLRLIKTTRVEHDQEDQAGPTQRRNMFDHIGPSFAG